MRLAELRDFKRVAITTKYWKPNEDYEARIVEALKERLLDGDIVVVSEKAISIATGRIADESKVKPGLMARLLAQYWMRYVWAYVLGPLCHLRRRTIGHFRGYPLKEGTAHKEMVLQECGLLQALGHGSEGGVDGTNLPYSLVSLPLNDALHVAEGIRRRIKASMVKEVTVIIADTDKTYSWRNFHFTSRPTLVDGVWSVGGFVAYLFGRMLKLTRRATPVAVAGRCSSVEETLEISEIANRARGFGAGRTIWDMARKFNVQLTEVSWSMLEKTEHKPIVIIRKRCDQMNRALEYAGSSNK